MTTRIAPEQIQGVPAPTNADTGKLLRFSGGTSFTWSPDAVVSVAGKTGAVALAPADVTGLPAALDGKAALVHIHTISDVVDLQTTLNGKAPTAHTHIIANVTGLQAALDGKAGTTHGHAIADVSGLQTALDAKAGTSHTHTIANVTGLQTALDAKAPTAHTHALSDLSQSGATNGQVPAWSGTAWVPVSVGGEGGEAAVLSVNGYTGIIVLSAADVGAAAATHGHAISDVTNLQTTLEGKAASTHGHAIADVTNLQTTLDGKAASSHTHAISDVTNLQTSLDGKAASSHSHAIADVTGLQTALDGKSATGHGHAISDVTNLQTTLDGKASSTHSHAIADVTDLQTTLDGKAAATHAHSAADITSGTLPLERGGTGATDAGGARTALGLGTIATQAANNAAITGGSVTGITDLAIADGGTGASTAPTALSNLGGLPLAGGTLTGALAVTAGTASAPGLTASGDSNTGIFFPAADTIAFTEGGVEAARIDSFARFGIGMVPLADNGVLQVGGYASVQTLIERATISAIAASGTINFDAATQAVLYYTSNSTANWTLNIRGSASLTLNTMLQTGQSLTFVFLATNGSTAFRATALQVDGVSVTPRWQGGTAPSSGNANSIDVYSYTIIKTANATFIALASLTRFA